MRLHSLSVTAFGPFADTVEVDFDELSADGLFLLSGPTGSGKTSILDAVCFALYGDVPGDRGSAKRLRSDQAAPGLTPQVSLELTVRGRRFRLIRSPQWTRPKKRGTGTTTEQAHVVCSERVDGDWVPLSNRLDEVGHLVTDLLGMNMAQFCQVALLPQGQFQGFLRARSDERHALLQRLFATDRFEQIERWLREHARSLKRDVADDEAALGRSISRVEEAADATAPAEAGEVEGWLEEQLSAARDGAEVARRQLTASTAARLEADNTLRGARELAGHQGLGRSAQATLATLDEQIDSHQRRLEARTAAQRAAVVLPALRVFEDAAAAVERHRSALNGALVEVLAQRDLAYEHELLDHDGSLPFDDVDAVAPLLAPAEARLREVEGLLPLAEELVTLADRLAQLDAEANALAEAVAADETQAAVLPERRASLETAIAEATEQRHLASSLQAEAAALDARHAAAERLELRRADHTRAEAAERAAAERVFDAKEAWLSAQESRLQGMAAELAASLAAGHACPVCGSGEHPHHAVAAPGTATLDDVKAARSRVDDAELARATAESELRSITAEVAALSQAAGDLGIAQLREERDAVRARREQAVAAADQLPALTSALRQLDAEQQAVNDRLAKRREAQAATAATEQTLQTRRERLEAEVGAQGLDLLARHRQIGRDLVASLRTMLRHHERLTEAVAAHRAAHDELAQALAAQQFPDADAARQAALPLERLRALEQAISEHQTRRVAAESTLQLPEVANALTQPAPELVALAEQAESAQAAEQVAIRDDASARRRAERVERLATQVRDALTALGPRREAAAVAGELAALLEGKSANNHLKMRLSAYVLSWRLAQVVAAANERLARMSDSRYLLEHTEQRGAQESRGGLSLVVRDAWSGEAREPATLSGGETFVVSLALALGLADVVAGEAGGTELDTLFVDEGFGSLDSETLDDVMDTLDALREGGRVVGVVSHVDQMRHRIPRQLRLTKGRAGSHAETHFSVA